MEIYHETERTPQVCMLGLKRDLPGYFPHTVGLTLKRDIHTEANLKKENIHTKINVFGQ